MLCVWRIAALNLQALSFFLVDWQIKSKLLILVGTFLNNPELTHYSGFIKALFKKIYFIPAYVVGARFVGLGVEGSDRDWVAWFEFLAHLQDLVLFDGKNGVMESWPRST